jgi:hypothetical protein
LSHTMFQIKTYAMKFRRVKEHMDKFVGDVTFKLCFDFKLVFYKQ